MRLDRDPYLHKQSLEVTSLNVLLVIVFVLPIPVGIVVALHVTDKYKGFRYLLVLVTFTLFMVFRIMYPTLAVADYN